MRRLLWTLLTTGACASVLSVAACGDDDNAAPSPGADSGVTKLPDGSTTTPDTGSTTPTDGGGDGGCTYAGFVLNLIKTQSTPSALPSADLGQACSDDQNQADFASLFP